MRKAAQASATAAVTITITMLALLAVLVPATSQAGAPLKGVDVKLGKAPGGGAAVRTTNENGKFDFGVVPKGTYYLSVALHEGPRAMSPATAAQRGAGSSNPAPQICIIELIGADGAAMQIGWDLKSGRRLESATQSAAKSGPAGEIIVNSDGQHPLNGTIVKSKSNITNN